MYYSGLNGKSCRVGHWGCKHKVLLFKYSCAKHKDTVFTITEYGDLWSYLLSVSVLGVPLDDKIPDKAIHILKPLIVITEANFFWIKICMIENQDSEDWWINCSIRSEQASNNLHHINRVKLFMENSACLDSEIRLTRNKARHVVEFLVASNSDFFRWFSLPKLLF